MKTAVFSSLAFLLLAIAYISASPLDAFRKNSSTSSLENEYIVSLYRNTTLEDHQTDLGLVKFIVLDR